MNREKRVEVIPKEMYMGGRPEEGNVMEAVKYREEGQ